MEQRMLQRKGWLLVALLLAALVCCAGLATPVWAGEGDAGATDKTVTVTVGVYDYTARTAELAAASSTGVVLRPVPVEVPAGSMAVDAVEAALKENYVSFTAPVGDYGKYILEINGLAELDGGPESGWLFCINGSFSNSGIAATEIQEGDELELHYSVVGYGTDVGNYWDALPILTSFTLAGKELILSSETAYDEDWQAATTYYVGEDDEKQVLPGQGTEEDPFLLTVTVDAATDLTQLTAGYTTVLHPRYRQLSLDITQAQDYTKPLELVLSTAGGTLKTYYQIMVVLDYGVSYTDVPEHHWAYGYIYDLTGRKVLQGNPDGSFGPENPVKRCDFVTMLYRMSGGAAPVAGSVFSDVPETAYYAQAVAWAVQAGVVSGRTETTFGPEQPIARQEIAAMLYRYAKHQQAVVEKMDVERLGQYKDGKETAAYALEAMEWCLDTGLLSGYTDGTLGPQDPATRAAVAKMTSRLLTWLAQ